MSEAEQPPPVPMHLLPGWQPKIHVSNGDVPDTVRDDFIAGLKKITPWKMKDLTIGSYVKLARMLVIEKKMWNKFSDLMWVD